MKKYIKYMALALVLSFISLPLAAQTALPDTLLNVSSPSRLVITENRNGASFNVREIAGNDTVSETISMEYPNESSVSSRQSTYKNVIFRDGFHVIGKGRESGSGWDVIVDGLCIGLNNASGMTGGDGLQWSKSFEIGWLSCIGVAYNYKESAFSLGFGFDWRNYKITTSYRCLVANADKGIEWGEYPDGARGKNSRLKVFSLQFPLLYRLHIPHTSLNLKAGPVFNFNTYASLKTSYENQQGNRCDDFTKDINPRRFTVDFFASLSLCNAVGVYVRYSPMKVMDAPGINFRPLTIGIGFGI